MFHKILGPLWPVKLIHKITPHISRSSDEDLRPGEV